MQAVSSDWDGAIRGAREKTCLVEVWGPGATSAVVLVAKAGSIRVDESSAVRRALNLSLADLYAPDGTPLTPRKVSDLLAPFGTEIRVWSGHQYTSGWTEMVPVGVFTLTDTNRPSWLAALELTAPDRSRSVSLARFLKPYNVAAGTLVTAVITTLVQRGGAFPVVDLSGSRTLTTAASYEAGADPWEKARELATSIGCEVAPDATGVFVIRPVPQVATPVWSVDIDKTKGALLDIGQKMTAEGVYNALAVSSSAAGVDPVIGYAWVSDGDMAVTKPGVGWRTTFFSTPIGITTTDQAMAAAAAMLPSKMAAARILEPVAVANVALDVGDTIALSVPISKDRTSQELINAVVSSLSFSLEPNAGGMRLGVRYPAPVTTGTVVTGS